MSLNDELANDRTFLAWLRTGIALFGLGFVVAKIAYLINPAPSGLSDRDFYTIVGVLIVLSGAALILVGFWQHRVVVRSFEPTDRPPPRWPVTIAIAAAVGSVVLSALIVISSS